MSWSERCVLSPKLSVVVPFYNVEAYFEACLESLAVQRFGDLEVIMVDDGSGDGSLAIAEARAAADPRFRVVRQENQGLGPARNTGARHAKGEYLAFADSDDVVPPHAYQAMITSLEASGSDFATGNVQRLEVGGALTQSALHRGLPGPGRRTHISREHGLLHDRTAWNKVFRRSFWDSHGFAFPAGWYEDSPVTLPAHVRATAVDVVGEPVYQWRRRVDSISEGRAGAANLSARIAVMQGVRDVLPAGYHRDFDRILLDVDVEILLRSLPALPPEDQQSLAKQVAALVSRIDPSLVGERPVSERICLRLMAEDRFDDLHQILEDQRRLGGPRLRRDNGRWHVDYPFLDGSYDVTDTLRPQATVDRLHWDGSRLHLSGRTHLPGIPGGQAKVFLRPSGRIGSAFHLDLDTTPVAGGEPGAFTAVIDPARLKVLGRWWDTDWKLCVKLTAEGLTRKHSFGCATEALATWPDPRPVAEGTVLRPIGGPGRCQLRTERSATRP